MILRLIKILWVRFWLNVARLCPYGRIANHIAAWGTPPYYGRTQIAKLNPKGYIAYSATIHHDKLEIGTSVFIGDKVIIYQDNNGGLVSLEDNVHLHCYTIIQTGHGGSLMIGSNTHIQPRCQLSAYKAPIKIGCRVEIAPNCAFYSYDHGIAPEKTIKDQPLKSKGGIVIEDDVWLGVGVIVLDGVKIGRGAVIGAGAVVTHDVPEGAIATGVPARVVKMRNDIDNMVV